MPISTASAGLRDIVASPFSPDDALAFLDDPAHLGGLIDNNVGAYSDTE